MDLKTKQVVVRQLAKQYKKSSKKEKGAILTELVRLTVYNRSYARFILRKLPVKEKVQRRVKGSKYQVILKLLRRLWVVSNFACGQLLVSAMPDLMEHPDITEDTKLNLKKK